MRAAQFAMDDFGPFDGYTDGTTWNGFARPWFPKATADALMAQWNREASTIKGHYDAATDTYHFLDTARPDWGPEAFEGTVHEVGGTPVTLYPLGNGSWVWDDITPTGAGDAV